MNALFDIFNVKEDKRIADPEGNFRLEELPFGAKLEEQKMFLDEAYSFVQTMRKRGKTKNPALLPFQKGLMLNCKALPVLHETLQEMFPAEEILIPTMYINQDALERFFGVIRAMGHTYTSPTALEFKYRMRKYLILKNPELLIKHSAYSNVLPDDTEVINLTGLVRRYLQRNANPCSKMT